MLERLGRAAARRRWFVVVAWLVLAVGIGVLASQHGGTTNDDFSIPGTESQDALDLLTEDFPQANDLSATVVFHVDTGKVTDSANATAISDSLTALGQVDGVTATPTDPLTTQLLKGNISEDEQTVYTSVRFGT